MSKTGVSKASTKNALLVLGVAIMYLITLGPTGSAANTNKIYLDSSIANGSSTDIMVGGASIYATLTFTSQDDSQHRKMDVYLVANFPGGEVWSYDFFDTALNPIDGNTISVTKGSSETVKFRIKCKTSDGCEDGDSNQVQIYGKTDPQWFDGGTDSGTTSGCKLTNSCVDTTAASSSFNATNVIALTFNARTDSSSTLVCDDESSSGDNLMYQGQTYGWDYTLTNTGWSDDSYSFATSITSDDAPTDGWDIKPGIDNGKQLTGQNDASPTAVHETDGTMSILPSSTARPGVYNIVLDVTASGSTSSCNFNVVVPSPDLEIKNEDITFSHTGAWITGRGDSQKVTIYAEIRNKGGSVDSSGVTTTDIIVTFLVDGAQLGSTHKIASLGYGEEHTLKVDWNPTRKHDKDEVGIPITVSVDTPGNIEDSNNDNNEATAFFKVVEPPTSNPSFYLGFISLIAAVGAAVLLSTYYRNKEDLEE